MKLQGSKGFEILIGGANQSDARLTMGLNLGFGRSVMCLANPILLSSNQCACILGLRAIAHTKNDGESEHLHSASDHREGERKGGARCLERK